MNSKINLFLKFEKRIKLENKKAFNKKTFTLYNI
jgi:hypothetical protein